MSSQPPPPPRPSSSGHLETRSEELNECRRLLVTTVAFLVEQNVGEDVWQRLARQAAGDDGNVQRYTTIIQRLRDRILETVESLRQQQLLGPFADPAQNIITGQGGLTNAFSSSASLRGTGGTLPTATPHETIMATIPAPSIPPPPTRPSRSSRRASSGELRGKRKKANQPGEPSQPTSRVMTPARGRRRSGSQQPRRGSVPSGSRGRPYGQPWGFMPFSSAQSFGPQEGLEWTATETPQHFPQLTQGQVQGESLYTRPEHQAQRQALPWSSSQHMQQIALPQSSQTYNMPSGDPYAGPATYSAQAGFRVPVAAGHVSEQHQLDFNDPDWDLYARPDQSPAHPISQPDNSGPAASGHRMMSQLGHATSNVVGIQQYNVFGSQPPYSLGSDMYHQPPYVQAPGYLVNAARPGSDTTAPEFVVGAAQTLASAPTHATSESPTTTITVNPGTTNATGQTTQSSEPASAYTAGQQAAGVQTEFGSYDDWLEREYTAPLPRPDENEQP